MCLVLGGLGGVLAATAYAPEPAAARFVPPREQAFDFSLRNQDGVRTSLADARGKVIALTFIYAYCRDLCPAEGAAIAQAMRDVGGDDVVTYIVSVDPVGDTPGAGEGLARAARARRPRPLPDRLARRAAAGLDPLRDRADERVARRSRSPPPRRPTPSWPPTRTSASGRSSTSRRRSRRAPPEGADDAYPDPADLAYRGRARHIAGWDFEHSAYVMLIDKRGQQRLGIPFESLDSRSLARDLRALLAEPA